MHIDLSTTVQLLGLGFALCPITNRCHHLNRLNIHALFGMMPLVLSSAPCLTARSHCRTINDKKSEIRDFSAASRVALRWIRLTDYIALTNNNVISEIKGNLSCNNTLEHLPLRTVPKTLDAPVAVLFKCEGKM